MSEVQKNLRNIEVGNFEGFDAERFKKMNIKEYQEKFESEFETEFRHIVRNHKKNEKALAPLMFPIRERERRKKHGLAFSEVSTPKSSILLSASNQVLASRGGILSR